MIVAAVRSLTPARLDTMGAEKLQKSTVTGYQKRRKFDELLEFFARAFDEKRTRSYVENGGCLKAHRVFKSAFHTMKAFLRYFFMDLDGSDAGMLVSEPVHRLRRNQPYRRSENLAR